MAWVPYPFLKDLFMKPSNQPYERGQSNIEYALLIVLLALIIIPVLAIFHDGIFKIFGEILPGQVTETAGPATAIILASTASPQPTATTQMTNINKIAMDFFERIMDYYAMHGKWPSSSSSKEFTDLGLKVSDWNQAVEGIYWNPNGSTIFLENKKSDNLQMYVNNLTGNKLQVYDGWSIVCEASSSMCYYHTIAPGNEVDINSITVEQTKK